ncbi:hypothetical protein EYF80_049589 [Liparis tanakae]|uniref:Uncharacterized protein n=1 Tax=Liparis tanakae TaxID=230148 RepID=A0A4Z2FGE6_9TELE|nr:hypothetical protein EYF80_049589 [Liparis tanakae]
MGTLYLSTALTECLTLISVIWHTITVEDLEVLIHIHPPLEELLQVLERNLHHVVVDAVVPPVRRKHRELVAHEVRRVLVELHAAVGRPHVLRHGHPVQVVAADGVPGGGHPGDHEGLAAAVVVEALAEEVLVLGPRPHVELPALGHHVGQAVGGGFVQRLRLVLVGVQLAPLVLHHVGVVLQHRLGVLEVHVHA